MQYWLCAQVNAVILVIFFAQDSAGGIILGFFLGIL